MGSCVQKPKKLLIEGLPEAFPKESKYEDQHIKTKERLFKIYDADRDGLADERDLDRALQAIGYYMPKVELLKHVEFADLDKDGKVSFSEYLAFEMDPLTQKIRECFFDLDVKTDGYITREDLNEGIQRMGTKLPENVELALFETIDAHPRNGINFNEFFELIMKTVYNV
ncbi:hypothetical protein L596_020661 [Steinernema carpocapsae]|uniref:EF-hand domain-containing protein n=1 Tax=Steinernema carpocapsae TaxID=34508 RepID=A0A4U5MUV7_STECR|nr:hypothetical protein L596_020661 [Steinernema carpocapsae]